MIYKKNLQKWMMMDNIRLSLVKKASKQCLPYMALLKNSPFVCKGNNTILYYCFYIIFIINIYI